MSFLDKAKDIAEDVKDKAEDVIDKVEDKLPEGVKEKLDDLKDKAGDLAAKIGDKLPGGLGDKIENALCVFMERLAGSGQLYATPTAFEELRTESSLQILNMLADPRLGHEQTFGSPAEATFFDNVDKDFKFIEIEHG